jgi:2-polyprenyl-6-methoxyphenol hydroxylase-like FAD-dependent oxidoreductase
MPTTAHAEHEVVVVGGRCAGAPTALLLARAGHDVLVVDRAPVTRDVTSTHSIARGGVVQLHRWGLLDEVLAAGTAPVRSVRFGADGSDVTRTVKARSGVDLLVAPRRTVLDPILAAAAVSAGATVDTGIAATGVRRDGSGRVIGLLARTADGHRLEIGARFVVGADGLRSRTAGWAGAAVLESYPTDAATLYTYVHGAPFDGHEYHVGPEAFAGVFVTARDEACLWLCRPAAAMRSLHAAGGRADLLLDEVASIAPGLAARARRGAVAAPVRGMSRLPNHLRRAYGPGWALVGDAGYHRDPITGHGITDAFRDAELLATALDRSLRDPAEERAAMREYAAQRDAALRPTFDLTVALARFPDPARFVELQKQLSDALEREAEQLAALPAFAGAAAAA